MTQQVIALVGISGVGKSTLLHALSTTTEFQHLQASGLIREARATATTGHVTGDSLRLADIDENQRLLVEGFKGARHGAARLIVLDGHTVIDAPAGLQLIAPEVFAAIGVTQFVFLADLPTEIHRRRASDTSKSRPARTAAELEQHQNSALQQTLKVSLRMSVPVVVVMPTHIDFVCELFASVEREAP